MFIDRNYKATMDENTTWFLFLLDFVNSLNLNDLQELSSGEMKEVWKLLTTFVQSTFSTESAYTNSSSNWDNTFILISSKKQKACVSNFFSECGDLHLIWKAFFFITIYWKKKQLHLKIYTIHNFCFIFGMHNIKELLIFLKYKYKNKLT